MAWQALAAPFIGAAAGALFDKGGDQRQSSSNEPWAPYQPYLKDYAQELDANIGQRQYYGGDMVADFTPDQLKSMGMLTGAADDLSTYNNQLGASMGTFMDPSFMDPNRNPYQSGYVDAALRPIDQRYNEQVMPGIRGNSRMTGGSDYGSTRQGVAEGIATRGYLDTVGDVTSRINTDLYGKNIDATQRAMSMSPMLAQMMGVPGSLYGQVGSMQQIQNQGETNANVDKYNWERDLSTEDMYRLMGSMQNNPYNSQTKSVSDGGGGTFMNIAGGAMMGSSLWDNFGNTNDTGGGWDAWDSSYDDNFFDPNDPNW